MIPKDKQGRLLKRPLAAMVAILGMGSLAAEAGVLYFDFNQNYNPPNASVFLFGQSGQTATVSNLDGFSQNVALGVDGFFRLCHC